jgi:DNA ligase (NAD+)
MTVEQIKSKIIEANYYYRIGEPIMPDYKYDELVEKLQEFNPEDDLLSHIGFQVSDRKEKLPIDMASMNKVKTIEEVADWMRLKGISIDEDFIVTPKYDGLSLCVNEKHQIAYTRGDGTVGQLSTLHYSKMQGKLQGEQDIDFTYGEAIIPKKAFVDFYSGEFANARNLVSGLFNSKDPSDSLKDCVFIKYGAVGHSLTKKSDLIDRLNFEQEHKVPYLIVKAKQITDDFAISLFKEWSQDFEIDGIIIEINDLAKQEKFGRETSSNNPVWARALKHKGFETSAISTVKGITWNVSKQGFLKPTINIDAVSLDGVVISNVTGNNARYIKEMGIGVGSSVVVVRSGMVIPVITQVMTTKDFEMPVGYDVEWNENGVELQLKAENREQVIQKVVSFFEILETKGFSEGVICQILDHYDYKWTSFKEALQLILTATKQDLLQIYRFGDKKATTVVNAVTKAVKDCPLEKIQHATGLFIGLGSKKLELLKGFDYKPSVEEVCQVPGFAEKSAQVFVDNWDNFYNFIDGLPITIKKEVEEKVIVSDDFSEYSFCFTGVRLPEAEEKIKSRGGKIASGVTKTTTHLVTKSKDSGSSKEKKAQELGIKIIDTQELEAILNS